ncbi:predicted protein [Plenodomus lingam JN3]|uniref:Predicted protein n=1 Tax=Leptosphaeria maculans (strain JN3 / isolate v23.1.3 / race Av1-4-5-6-7-8) TaxID=985895 RepID=E5A2K0_LEPMJ|nr:predicted protein [Plenodomus lingam JN3]CBX97796.1 predicted protein [Plenodomus lingam JN3]
MAQMRGPRFVSMARRNPTANRCCYGSSLPTCRRYMRQDRQDRQTDRHAALHATTSKVQYFGAAKLDKEPKKVRESLQPLRRSNSFYSLLLRVCSDLWLFFFSTISISSSSSFFLLFTKLFCD